MTIAVAHSVSATSRLALEHAVKEAVLRRTDLAVLHVVGSLDADRAEAYRLGISDEVEKVVAGQEGLSWHLHLETATASVEDVLLGLIDTVGAELVVVGARRRSPLGKALMGSVAQNVILEAKVPVLVVKS
jgi:nucleotide-binding universal stress UspA family protein